MVATQQAIDLATIAAHAAADKLATTITGLDVSGQMPLTDIFLIVSADNERQVQAIVDIKMPPTFTHEGSVAAAEARRRSRLPHPP